MGIFLFMIGGVVAGLLLMVIAMRAIQTLEFIALCIAGLPLSRLATSALQPLPALGKRELRLGYRFGRTESAGCRLGKWSKQPSPKFDFVQIV